MPVEIERRFLVVSDDWRSGAGEPQRFCQGYLAKTQRGTVRVRRAGDKATVTVKGRRRGPVRPEFEYPIPAADAEEMLRDLCVKPLIEKRRFTVEHRGAVWEIDEFQGAGAGLVIAEIELADPEARLELPGWVGDEVTQDTRFAGDAIARGDWPRG